jgi:hypothetical protein
VYPAAPNARHIIKRGVGDNCHIIIVFAVRWLQQQRVGKVMCFIPVATLLWWQCSFFIFICMLGRELGWEQVDLFPKFGLFSSSEETPAKATCSTVPGTMQARQIPGFNPSQAFRVYSHQNFKQITVLRFLSLGVPSWYYRLLQQYPGT